MKVAALVLLVGIVICGADGKTDEEMEGPKKPIPDDNLFKDPSTFCEGCYGMVQELDKLLQSWSKESGSLEQHIDAAILAVCSTDRLRAYVLSPPKMMRLCSGIRAHYENELGMALLQHYSAKKVGSPEKMFKLVCYKAIPACPVGMQSMSIVRKEKMDKAAEERRVQEEQEKRMAKEENTKTDEDTRKKDNGTKKKEKESKKKVETKKDEL